MRARLTIAALGVLALAACGSSTPTAAPAPSTSPAAAPSTSAPTTPSHATAPTPGTPRSYQAYMDCLDDPATTLAYCQQFNDTPSSSPPTPTPTPSAGPAQHFTGKVRLLKGPFNLTLGNGQLTGCQGGEGTYSDVGGTTALVVKSGGVTLASVPLGSGAMNGSECDFTVDLGTFPQQTECVTSFSTGKHGTLTWTLSEMQGKNYVFGIDLGKA